MTTLILVAAVVGAFALKRGGVVGGAADRIDAPSGARPSERPIPRL